jgi:hypothetical protein
VTAVHARHDRLCPREDGAFSAISSGKAPSPVGSSAQFDNSRVGTRHRRVIGGHDIVVPKRSSWTSIHFRTATQPCLGAEMKLYFNPPIASALCHGKLSSGIGHSADLDRIAGLLRNILIGHHVHVEQPARGAIAGPQVVHLRQTQAPALQPGE